MSTLTRLIERIPPRFHSTAVYLPVLIVAALIRLINLGSPHAIVFDEVYYVRDAWSMWNLGYEAQWVAAADFAHGDINAYSDQGAFVAHPPLGKWLIALGMAAFGPTNPVGWRITTALAGIAVVLLVMVIARRLFRSLGVAALAGFFVAIDGIAITMSRTALLDGILAMFILAAFLAVLRHLDTPGWGGWLIVAGLLLGAATAVKWSGLYALLAFGIWVTVVETVRHYKANKGFDWLWGSTGSLLKNIAFVWPIAIVTYIASWSGWFATRGGWGRTWAEDTGVGSGVWGAIRSFWKYHRDIYDYNVGLTASHSYAANPFTWLALIRPTAFYYEPAANGLVQYVTSIANPILWWAGGLSLIVLIVAMIRRPSWNIGAILVGVGATYVPWLFFSNRTMFQFYTVTLEPFLVLAVVWVLVWMWGKHLRFVVVAFVALVVAISAFFLPVWMGIPIPDWFAMAHYWFPNWI
jgi:dolichyl-phosphate-mannose--protein O-mannosyl transferase